MKTINEQIERLRELIRKCYGAVATKLGDVPSPEDRTMENLPTAISSIKYLDQEDLDAAWDTFKGGTGMIPKEEQTIGNLKYAIRMNAEEMDVNEINFVDFNGLVLSMTIEEVMQLTEMPKPNEYYNLTFEKWSETLEEIQDGRCHTVGAFYHTTDGCNYYVVEITKDGGSIEMQPKNAASHIYWGDGTDSTGHASNSITHTYDKKGRYTIKIKNPSSATAYYYDDGSQFVEIYYSDKLSALDTQMFRFTSRLRKLSIPSHVSGNMYQYNFGFTKLKSLILPDLVTLDEINYGVKWADIEYLVANGSGRFSLPTCNNLKCFSCKGVTIVDVPLKTTPGYIRFQKLKNIVFDNVTTINGFSRGGDYRDLYTRGIVDIPETCTKINNNSLRVCPNHVYMRTLTPPTLGGTSVFWWNDYGLKVTIHIRKDATYTDANGDTWTGLEAYAHATNWATLYASSNFTFIDDL